MLLEVDGSSWFNGVFIIIIIIRTFIFIMLLLHLSLEMTHNENTPIQIYRKFYLQKLKIFR